MQFSQGRLEFQELYIGCPSAPPPGVDRVLALGQDASGRTEASGVCGMRAVRVLRSQLRLMPNRACPTCVGPSLKPSWSPGGSQGRHGCLLVRQAQGLVGGSSFWGAARILAACPGPSLLMLGSPPGSQGQPCSVLPSPPHSLSSQKQEPGPQPSQEKTDTPRKDRGKFFSAPGLPCTELPLLGEAVQAEKLAQPRRMVPDNPSRGGELRAGL